MSFSPIHIWASMGLLSKVIASLLLVMATMSLAVVVERWVALIRAKGETRRFLARGRSAPRRRASIRRPPSSPTATRPRRSRASSRRSCASSPRARRRTSRASSSRGARPSARRRRSAKSCGAAWACSRRSARSRRSSACSAPSSASSAPSRASRRPGSGGLGAVSAGISEALVETALGLMVAIPAVLFFNQLNNKINVVETELARRTGELLDELENTHGSRDSGQLRKGRVSSVLLPRSTSRRSSTSCSCSSSSSWSSRPRSSTASAWSSRASWQPDKNQKGKLDPVTVTVGRSGAVYIEKTPTHDRGAPGAARGHPRARAGPPRRPQGRRRCSTTRRCATSSPSCRTRASAASRCRCRSGATARKSPRRAN